MTLPAWQRVDPRDRQRERWRRIARDEIRAALDADEPTVAEAFAIVEAVVRGEKIPGPRTYSRTTLKGRDEVRAQAIELGRSGLSARVVATLTGVPYVTCYQWLRRAGVATTREEWLDRVRSR